MPFLEKGKGYRSPLVPPSQGQPSRGYNTAPGQFAAQGHYQAFQNAQFFHNRPGQGRGRGKGPMKYRNQKNSGKCLAIGKQFTLRWTVTNYWLFSCRQFLQGQEAGPGNPIQGTLNPVRPPTHPVHQEPQVLTRRDNRFLNCIRQSLDRQEPFKAGSLSDNIDAWENLTSDSYLLDTVRGFSLDFIDFPNQTNLPGQILRGQTDIAIANELLQDLLSKGVIEPTVLDRSGYISNIFIRPKASGSHRLILNLKQLNEHVEYHHFKMEHLSSVLPLVTQNCFLASLDLADAYYSVRVKPSHRKYLQFTFQGNHYRFTCLANGISSAPRTFTKLMKVPLSTLRQQHGLIVTAYLDDLLLIAPSPRDLLQAIDITQQTLRSLGFRISIKKSAIEPSHQVQFLGFLINSATMSVRLPDQKMSAITSVLQNSLTVNSMSIRAFATLVGKLTATLPANRYGQVFLKHLEVAKTKALARNWFDFDRSMALSPKVLTELKWWLDNVTTAYRPVHVPNPEVVMSTDASFQGWGYHLKSTNAKFGGRWTVEERTHDINYLELKAVHLSLLSACKHITNTHILILSDNTTTVVGINRQGSTHSSNCNSVTRDIWLWAMQQNNWLSSTHCPGVSNVEADYASRVFNDTLEWQLHPDKFKLICSTFGMPVVDLFASRLNCHLPTYCSWQPDPGAAAIDCFTLDWQQFDNRLIYAFPPFSVVARTLQKIEAESTAAVIVVPHWPTQPWFGKLLHLMQDPPLVIPVNQRTLRLVHNPGARHSLAGRLTLWACFISKDTTNDKVYPLKSLRLCHKRKDCPPTNNITLT